MDEASIRRVHLVFKTHLDLGFTDLAERIVELYLESLIPKALDLAEALRRGPGNDRFRWTTGSWLVNLCLERYRGERLRRMERAIESGDIVWHALPFTTHTEYMSGPSLRHGLSIAQRLDRRFGRRTIAAKMTDVPGHTRGMVPLLADAGVRFLHIGVNPAANPPDVPPVFRWHDETSGTELLVNYHHRYGETTLVPGVDDALALVFTGDNKGPQSQEEVIERFQQRRERFAHAEVTASTLDAFADALETVRDRLPVVTAEIGDTWIHGVGTDPQKTARFRALQRLRDGWVAHDPAAGNAADVRAMSDRLLLVAEHTWGLDEKENLGDYTTYDRAGLAVARRQPRWRRFESSWGEQRAYIDDAIAQLRPQRRSEAEEALRACVPERSELDAWSPLPTLTLQTPRWTVSVDAVSGGLTRLVDRRRRQSWAQRRSPLFRPRYDLYTEADYERYLDRYLWRKPEWAILDNAKPRMDRAGGHRLTAFAAAAQAYSREEAAGVSLLVAMHFAGDAVERFGCPPTWYTRWWLPHEDDTVEITVDYFDKPPCRIAEALWLVFAPRVAGAQGWRLRKMGTWVDPLHVARKGGRRLHAVESCRHEAGDRLVDLSPLDSALLSPGEPGLLNFSQRRPRLSEGMHLNLFNNIWGTNFPMWSEGDARFRFILRLQNGRGGDAAHS